MLSLTKMLKTALALLVISFSLACLPLTAFAAPAPPPSDAEISKQLSKNPIVEELNTIVNFLSAGVGIVIVIVIIIGGIQYSMAGDNPQAVAAARQRIINGLLALAVFLLMVSFLQWLIPGGVFK